MQKNIPWWQPELTGKELSIIKQVLTSNYLNEGSYTKLFERKIAKLLRIKHAVAVTNGTAAIFLALKAFDIGPSDEVIIPDLSFVATANAVTLSGATPILMDIEPTRLTLNSTILEKTITSKTKAIIPVHISGRGANMKDIGELAQKYNLAVIEDAAEAFMSKYKNKFLGTWGDMGCFSFSPMKTIMTGQGGIVVTNQSSLAIKLRQLKDQGRPTRGTGGADEHPIVGFNFKLTNLHAAVGLAQLTALTKRLTHQKRNYTIYQKLLEDTSEIKLFPFNVLQGEIPQWVDAYAEKRNELIQYLETKKIFCQPFWHPIHTHTPYQHRDFQFPITSKLSPHLLWLPSSFTLSDKEINYVCNHIKTFYSSKTK